MEPPFGHGTYLSQLDALSSNSRHVEAHRRWTGRWALRLAALAPVRTSRKDGHEMRAASFSKEGAGEKPCRRRRVTRAQPAIYPVQMNTNNPTMLSPANNTANATGS